MIASAAAQDADIYEWQRVERYLAAAGLQPAAAPEGKTIDYVRVVRREVLEGDDLLVPIVLPRFAPTWPNQLHWLTAEATVARELLLHEGEPFRAALAEESMRNLRALGIFALVRIVAVRTNDPTRVGLVVYTRDLWSLRFEQQFSGVGENFSLGAQLVERNFLGRNKALALRFFLDPVTYSVGQTFLDARVLGGDLRLYQAFDLILNRSAGELEGSAGTLRLGRPYYSLSQRFSFYVLAKYAVFVHRDVSAGEVIGFDARQGDDFGGSCAIGGADCLPRVWEDRSLLLEAAVSHRAGTLHKQTFTAGAGASARGVQANAETALDPSQRAVFAREVLPRERREVYPFVSYRLELPRFAVFNNLATFGQSENVQTGPLCEARFAVPLQLLGSRYDAFSARGTLGYVFAEHDFLVDVIAQGAARLDRSEVVDQSGYLRLRAATPSLTALHGRLVVRGIWDVRRRDTQNSLVALGGDSGLRGYASQAFYGFGASRWLSNLEYRTQPWAIESVHLGMVAFYDVGAVYRQLSAAHVRHDVGLGLRVLFPQFNRYVFRVDWGVPLSEPGFALMVSYGSEQAVMLTAAEDALSGAQLGWN